MEELVRDGGFALVTGDLGTGNSVTLRVLSNHLGALPDNHTGVLTRPQSGIGDSYRELGAPFGVLINPTVGGYSAATDIPAMGRSCAQFNFLPLPLQ